MKSAQYSFVKRPLCHPLGTWCSLHLPAAPSQPPAPTPREEDPLFGRTAARFQIWVTKKQKNGKTHILCFYIPLPAKNPSHATLSGCLCRGDRPAQTGEVLLLVVVQQQHGSLPAPPGVHLKVLILEGCSDDLAHTTPDAPWRRAWPRLSVTAFSIREYCILTVNSDPKYHSHQIVSTSSPLDLLLDNIVHFGGRCD